MSDKPAIAVCGAGRCGSTMMMGMLDAGGYPPVRGTDPISYETDIKDIERTMGSPRRGKSVKLLDHPMHSRITRFKGWLFIVLHRNPYAQAASMNRFFDLGLGQDDQMTLARSIADDRSRLLEALERAGGIILETSYEYVANNGPDFARYLGLNLPDFDVEAAAQVPEPRVNESEVIRP